MSSLVTSRRALVKGALAAMTAAPLTGCGILDPLRDRSSALRDIMLSINHLTYRVHRMLQGENALAAEFSESQVRQGQRPNGSTDPDTSEYLVLKDSGFAAYRLEINGLVERPMTLGLAQLHRMPQRTQITRHDCVEGWSCIAKWQGVPLRLILDAVGLKPSARFVVFHCYDAPTRSLSGLDLYYESIDLVDARHPQTILAHTMNDAPLPVANGAPLRLRVERQLGYKMAKYIRRIELVSHLAAIGAGRGSYWADRGYEWYAGI